jgi:hypothetical protein
LERTAPLRNLGKAFYQPSEKPVSAPQDERWQERLGEAAGAGLEDAVADGVRLGYGVIEDQIRRAQGLASRLSPGSQGLLGAGLSGSQDEIRALLDQLLRTYGDLTNVWLQVLHAALGNADVLNALFGKDGAKANGTSAAGNEGRQAAPESAPKASQSAAAVAFSVLASGPVEIDIRLFGGGFGSASPVMRELCARESGAPPLADVALIPAAGDEPARVVVRVPAEQPPGLYQGLILDRRSDAPLGVLGVRLGAA